MTRRKRPRPVVIFGAALAGLGALTTAADVTNVLPEGVLTWARLVFIVGGAVFGSLYVQKQVTPLSDPRDAAGRRLVPQTRQQAPGYIPSPPQTFTTGSAPVVLPPRDGGMDTSQ